MSFFSKLIRKGRGPFFFVLKIQRGPWAEHKHFFAHPWTFYSSWILNSKNKTKNTVIVITLHVNTKTEMYFTNIKYLPVWVKCNSRTSTLTDINTNEMHYESCMKYCAFPIILLLWHCNMIKVAEPNCALKGSGWIYFYTVLALDLIKLSMYHWGWDVLYYCCFKLRANLCMAERTFF